MDPILLSRKGAKAPEPNILPRQEPVDSPRQEPTDLPRQEVLMGFVHAFSELHPGMSFHYNNEQAILSHEQMQEIAQWLEARIIDDLKAKFSGQQISPQQACAEYISACNDTLGYLKTPDGFTDAVQQFRGLQH
jgi:hypothetical protein